MQNKRILLILESATIIFGLGSKVLLSLDNIHGWTLSLLMLTCNYLFNKRKGGLEITQVMVVSSFILSIYGLVKWSGLSNFLFIDITILIVSVCASIYLYKKIKQLDQLFACILYVLANAFLSVEIPIIGWLCMIMTHTIMTSIFYSKKGYVLSCMQIISAVIGIVKVYFLLWNKKWSE